MKCYRIIGVLLVLLSVGLLQAEPRLQVVIAVEGMSEEALKELQPYLRQGGLRTIVEQGESSTVQYAHQVYGGTETLATLLTGEMPQRHGIASDKYFSRIDRLPRSVYDDPTVKGINTDQNLSAAALKTPTLTDAFRLRTTAQSRIYAVGVSAEPTLLLAGHSANAVAWLEPKQLQWASTSYYEVGLPSAADKQNMQGQVAVVAAREWQPRLGISTYMHPTADEQRKEFRYVAQNDLQHTPMANTLVVELALGLQEQNKLGTQRQPDMLLLQLTVVTPKAASDGLQSAEQEDMYLALNQDLGYLMEQLDKRIGQEAYEIILLGYPHFGKGAAALERANLKTHYFSAERAAALCNTYLMAIYGHERWIDGGYGHSIYLNRMLLEKKQMEVEPIARQVRDFLLEFEGTEAAFLQQDLHLLPAEGVTQRLRRSMPKRQVGDIVFTLEPYWVVGESAADCFDRVVEQDATSPLYIFSPTKRNLPSVLDATEVMTFVK